MRVLLVHPSALLYSEVYLRLEPLGMECVAAACRNAGHEVRLLDLQIFTRRDLDAGGAASFRPDVAGVRAELPGQHPRGDRPGPARAKDLLPGPAS